MPAETADAAIKALILSLDYSHPFYWAPFQYVGV
jgi:CHAT domain-containing protein